MDSVLLLIGRFFGGLVVIIIIVLKEVGNKVLLLVDVLELGFFCFFSVSFIIIIL